MPTLHPITTFCALMPPMYCATRRILLSHRSRLCTDSVLFYLIEAVSSSHCTSSSCVYCARNASKLTHFVVFFWCSSRCSTPHINAEVLFDAALLPVHARVGSYSYTVPLNFFLCVVIPDKHCLHLPMD